MARHNSKSLIGAMYQEDISLWLNRMKKDYQRKHINAFINCIYDIGKPLPKEPRPNQTSKKKKSGDD